MSNATVLQSLVNLLQAKLTACKIVAPVLASKPMTKANHNPKSACKQCECAIGSTASHFCNCSQLASFMPYVSKQEQAMIRKEK